MRYVRVREKNRIELPAGSLKSMGVQKGDRLLVITKGRMVILMPEPKKFAKPVYRKKKAVYPKYSYTLPKRKLK
jgi:bifunctional DNA-binding transcriptional regulator/antitoxin component of YhaV-PrlF toxin-antitoxin module